MVLLACPLLTETGLWAVLVPGQGSTKKNIEAITSFFFHWEETNINCSSYTRKRELKRYAARYLWETAAETEEQTAGGGG